VTTRTAPTARPTTRAAAINTHCRDCIADPGSPGHWREQVADCTAGGCALFAFRPVPRHCIIDGLHDDAAIAIVRERLARRGPA